jgi:antitoxin (DNA-binding transcriptional repressor) of toxin-antitoxin stability system
MTVSTQDAQINLSRLIKAALPGEEVILSEDGKNLVCLVAVKNAVSAPATARKLRPIGIYQGNKTHPDFEQRSMEPLREEELKNWM